MAQCTNGNLQLTDGSSGVLQICKNNEWRNVCSEDWGNLDTAVACRQYGYDGRPYLLKDKYQLVIIMQEATPKAPDLPVLEEPQWTL